MKKGNHLSQYPTQYTQTHALAAVFGGLIWIVLWVHFIFTHGPSSFDNKRLLLGLTWIDTGKFVVVPLMMFAYTLIGLRAIELHRLKRIASWANLGAITGLILSAVSVALLTWPVPFGQYPPSGVSQFPPFGGPLMFIGVLLGGFSLLIFGIVMDRVLITSRETEDLKEQGHLTVAMCLAAGRIAIRSY
jgi:hypothetical protein